MSFKGKAQTVLGLIEPDDLGVTLTHEHFFIDLTDFCIEPSDDEKDLMYQPISLENLSWVRSHNKSNLENMRPFDEELAIAEALLFKKAGGRTIVEQTPNNMGRDPTKLVHVALGTGLNIIMGTSYYRETFAQGVYGDTSASAKKQLGRYAETHMELRTEEDIAEEFIRDIKVGVGDTGIRAGCIGEIGCSWPLTDNEKKVLRAASMAQQRTGALISVHPGFFEDSPLEIIKVLSDAGADISRVVICHMCMSVGNHSTRCKIAETSCYLEWDLFGHEGFPRQATPLDIPSDWGRIGQIIRLIKEGYLSQILISHDICARIRLTRFGGYGYAHILNNIVPIIRQKGVTEEQIHTIIVENPKRAFTFV